MFKKKLEPHFGKLSIILIAAIILLIGADLLTKYFEEQFAWNAKIIPGFIEIRSGIHNPGCAFSLLNEHPEIGQPILITATFLLLIVMIFAFVFLPNRFVILKIAISLIIAGAIGNLVDRIAFRYVRDWFGLWMFGNIAYCNFADFWIVIGAILAVVDLLFLNEWAVFPLTKSAKAAQAAKKEAEESAAKKSLTENVEAGQGEVAEEQTYKNNMLSPVDDTRDKENGN